MLDRSYFILTIALAFYVGWCIRDMIAIEETAIHQENLFRSACLNALLLKKLLEEK